MVQTIDVKLVEPDGLVPHSGQNKYFQCNPSDVSPEILQMIEHNVDAYIKNRGHPHYNLGPKTPGMLKLLVAGPVFYLCLNEKKLYFKPGEQEISYLKENFLKAEYLISDPKRLEMNSDLISEYKKKKGLKNKVSLFLLKSSYLMFKDLAITLTDFIYNLCVQETSDETYNRHIQPSLRNALAIREYFRLEKIEERESVNSGLDIKVRQEIRKIPYELRNSFL